MSKKLSEKNKQIEALRGLALSMIIIFHIFDRYQQIYCNRNIVWLDQWGIIGTVVFMLISGFYMVKVNIFKTEIPLADKWKYIISVFARKILRLWPCYFVCITITFFATSFFYLPGRTVGLKEYFVNIFLINRFFGIPYVDGGHWYLGALISATFAVLIIECLSKVHAEWWYVIWLAASVALDMCFCFDNIFLFGGSYAGVFCAGAALNHIQNTVSRKVPWYAVLGTAIGITFMNAGLTVGLCLVLLIPIFVFCIRKRLVIIEWKPLLFMGEISYAVYLIHQNISYIIEYSLNKLWGGVLVGGTGFIALAVSILLGSFVYYLIEKPVQKRLKYRIDPLLLKRSHDGKCEKKF